MQRKRILYLVAILAILLAAVPLSASAQPAVPNSGAAESVGNEALPNASDAKVVAEGLAAAPPAAPINPAAVLYDNGPLVTNPGGGAGGADASALQTAVLNSTYGFGHAISTGFRVADDFTVPAGGWNISTITFYAYQTGSTTTSTINNVNLQIWDGPPGVGSVVFGDTSTNRLAGSSWSNIYRVLDTGLLDTARPVMADAVTVNTTLPAGTYWLDWQTGGTLGSGPWAPPVTLVGQTAKPGSNGLQFSPTTGAWAALIDTGSGAVQDLPFVIEGTGAVGPSISLEKTVGTTAGVCAGTSNISVAPGTTVYYCYTVTNTGDVTLDLHDLVDDQLGTIFTGFAYALAPGSSVSTVDAGLTISAVINANTTNVGTWTAYNQTGAQAQAQATATVTIDPGACPAGTTPNTLFSDDFESGAPGWTTPSGTGANTWALGPGVSGTPHSGSFVYHADDVNTVSEQFLVSPAIAVPSGQNPVTLKFWNYQEIEDSSTGCFDGGILDISTDGGATWSQVPNADLLTDPYNGPISASFSNPRAGDDAWCGDPQPWLNSLVDVSAYAGQTVQFRWVMATDNSVSHPGWDIDDVAVQSCEPEVQQQPVCWQGETPIPDNDPNGVATTLTVTDPGALADLNVSLAISHTWVGDLIITLEHVDTGTTATLFSQPGVPPATFGCSGNDINNTADDEALLTFENDCASPPNPGLAYIPGESYQGGDPAGPVLAAFDGEDYSGDWTLTVSDNAAGDTGTLYEWCLIPGEGAGEPPNIDVDPLSMASTQPPDTQVQQTLTISNTGGGTLDWAIDEEATTAPPAAPPSGPSSPTKLQAPAPVERSAKELTALLEAAMAEVVQDGSFEAGTPNPFWNEFSTNFGTPLCDALSCGTGGGTAGPLTGAWWAWFGGIAAYENGNVSQSVTIPSGGTATLSFWVWNGTCSGDSADYLAALIDGTELWRTTGAAPECGALGYREVTVDVSAYADDGAHLLEFSSEVFGTTTTNFSLDDVSLDAQGGGGEPCEVPSDIPWLSLDAYGGSNAGGTATDLTVTFDSTGLASGVYTGNLCVGSNDPDPGPGNGTDQVIVPVTLTVETAPEPPNIDVNPLSLESTQATNTTTNQPLTVANTGGGTLDWTIDEENTSVAHQMTRGSAANGAAAQFSAAPNVQGMSTPAPLAGLAAEAPEALVSLVVDDGTYENSIGLTNQVTNNAAVWFNRFTPTSDYPFTLQQMQILWPTVADAQINLVGQPVTLLVYTDTDGDGNPANATLVYQENKVIAVQDGFTFDVYNLTVPVVLNGPGDVLIGFVDAWNLGGQTAANFPAAIDQTASQGRSWIAGNGTTGVDPDINNLANNSIFGTIDSLGLPGNWMIRGYGETGGQGEPCTVLSDIPWLSLDVTNGSNAGGTNTVVAATFDSTGLANGVYTGNLCITSNDPDPGPGNGTDLVIVPVTLTVQPPTAVALTGLSAGVEQMPAPLAGLPLATLPAAAAAALGAAFVWRRKRDQ
ncbi:MAG: proprotein convertase P-domain-containing protein [Caldilineales bacterium]